MYKQIIIARKDLDMSPGKLAAQVSHGSMAFLSTIVRSHLFKIPTNAYPAWADVEERKPQYYRREDLHQWAKEAREAGKIYFFAEPVNPKNPYGALRLCDAHYDYKISASVDEDIYEWLKGDFTKCVLSAKNKNQLLKAKTMAEELGMVEGKDFFLIRDNCRTELTPEEDGRTLTVIGFKPMKAEVIDQIGKKFQLY